MKFQKKWQKCIRNGTKVFVVHSSGGRPVPTLLYQGAHLHVAVYRSHMSYQCVGAAPVAENEITKIKKVQKFSLKIASGDTLSYWI